jgi:DNA polymerase-3 subunit delta'
MSFIGHDHAWSEWRAALSGPRMHHGWILAGRRGIGKAGFAMQAARELVAEPGVAQPKGDHPDIIVLSNLPANKEEEKKRDEGKPYQLKRNISVDQIREMQHRLTTRPTLGIRRAIIIDPADDMEKGASNALLKSLEEPPVGSFFLLVTHRPGRLLPTIRSRCRMLSFPQLSREQLETILAREAPEANAATRTAAIAASGGSPGVALDFVEMDLGKLHGLMCDIAERGDDDFTLRGRMADAMGARPTRERQLAAVDLARAVAAKRMATIGHRDIPGLVEAHGELSRLSAQVPTYNFDPGLLVMEIGTLLTKLANSREAANG